MKVIHFIASIDKSAGGTTVYMQLLSSELKKQMDIVVVTGISPNPVNLDGIEVVFFNTNISRWFTVQKEFLRFLEGQSPDIVHINGIWNPENWLFQKAAQKLGIKVVLSPHGMLEPYILKRNSFKKRIALFLYQNNAIKKAEFLHATAISEYNNIQELGYKQPMFIIPNGINVSEIKLAKDVYGTRKAVFLSRIHPKKGIELLLEAWKGLETDQWLLEIAGDGEESYIDKLKSDANSMTNVSFVGPQYDHLKWDFIKSADVFILPTYSENFGIVVAEALASGVPVITTQNTPWEELETKDCGWWIELTQLNLQNTLKKAMNLSKEELKIKGANGIRLVKEKYDIKLVSQNMKELYEKLIFS